MKRADYIEMRKKILEECDEKLAALDKVFVMFGGTPLGPRAISGNGSGAAPSTWTHDMSKRGTVREVIKQIALPTFSLKDVRVALDTHYPSISQEIGENALSAILSKLAERKELDLVKAKVGKAPAVYSQPKAQPEMEQPE